MIGGPYPKAAPPKQLDWNLWLGQAPKVDYIAQRRHSTFRWWYEYAGGMLTDWGAHHVDIATWAMGYDKPGMGPIEIDGTDSKRPVPFKDGYPTVDDCFNTAYDFAIKCKYRRRRGNGRREPRPTMAIIFEGTKGRIFVDRGRITGKPIEEKWDKDKFGPEDLVRLYKGKPFEGHKANFYRCIREGGSARLGRLHPRHHDEHLPPLFAFRAVRPGAPLGPQGREDRGRRPSRRVLLARQRKGFEIPKL